MFLFQAAQPLLAFIPPMHPLFSSPTAQLSNSANEYATNATNGITSVNAEPRTTKAR
jgi:hypothetical protein